VKCPDTNPKRERGKYHLLPFLPAALCLAINLAILGGVALNQPEYLRDYRLNDNSDAAGYVLLGRNFFLEGHYSRRHAPPYMRDMLRTPVYPLFAGGLDLVGRPLAIYAAQALLQVGSCLLLFAMVRPYFGLGAALVASLLMATDLVLAVSNFEAMSEPLFVFLVLAAVRQSLPALAAITQGQKPKLRRLALAGLFLGLAILTRPAGLYLPAALAACFVIAAWRAKRLAYGMTAALVFLLATAPLPALWVARNAAVFSVPRLTTVDAANKVYYMASGAYQLHFDISPEEAQALIAKEHDLPSYTVVQNPWLADCPIAEMDEKLRAASFGVMMKYPVDLLESSVLGVFKASFAHNTGLLAAFNGRAWDAPGSIGLLRLEPEAVQRLKRNGPVLVAAFSWEMFHILFAQGLGAVGVAYCVTRRPVGAVTWTLVLLLGYFYLTVTGFGLEAFARCRAPVLPYLYAFAGVGLGCVFSSSRRLLASLWPKKRSEFQQVPA